MSFVIAQADGAGVGAPSLATAWIGVPVQLSGGTFNLLDKSDGLSVAITPLTTTTATLLATGIVGGSVRVECIDADGASTIRVIEFTANALGVQEAVAGLPCAHEGFGERNGARGWVSALDAIVKDLRDRLAALE